MRVDIRMHDRLNFPFFIASICFLTVEGRVPTINPARRSEKAEALGDISILKLECSFDLAW